MKREPLLDHMTKIRSQKEWKKKGQGVPHRKASGSPSASSSPKTAERPATGSRATAPFRRGDVVRWKYGHMQHKPVVRVLNCWASSEFGSGFGVDVMGMRAKKRVMTAWDAGHFLMVHRPALGIGAKPRRGPARQRPNKTQP